MFKSLRISSFLMYHSAFVIILSIFDCVRWISCKWDLLAVPQSSVPFVHIAILLCNYSFECFPISQLSCRNLFFISFLLFRMCCFHVSFESIVSPRYLTYGCNNIWLSLFLIEKFLGCRFGYMTCWVLSLFISIPRLSNQDTVCVMICCSVLAAVLSHELP